MTNIIYLISICHYASQESLFLVALLSSTYEMCRACLAITAIDFFKVKALLFFGIRAGCTGGINCDSKTTYSLH